ncbi:catalase-domain-containing protein [Rhizodiscina lignyota]|uniref:Catalase-domain-containing protein n=1 Tax=Rhizodiscina lignyota TaxID=1504668 RepID=A0A9P4M6S8_9PEZI|nr:catalase-domain-containing protein [Rhizodiscina lignyota]
MAPNKRRRQPVPDPTTALRIPSSYGTGGLVVLSDTQLIETLAHFARERIPERSVHAKAAGAWGEFEVTHDNSDLTDAKFLNGVGTKTKVLCRISTVAGEKGASDTVRDVRGWATKFFTEEGNQDFVFNDLPVFFIRDPIKFPSMNRSHKRHPRTNVPDDNMFWDFHEGIHALMQLFGQRGIPASLRNIAGYGVHTYTLGKEDGTFKYIKWHWKPDAGIETLPADVAVRLAGEDPDYHIKDLFNSIEKGNYPSWTLNIQVMSPYDVSEAPIDIFDPTFTWPHAKYPLRQVGRLTLNKNPDNYFQDIEQAAFSPSNMVPGVGPSADMVLQARMFSYPDAARYRVGPNYQQLPNNRPINPVYSPYQRDGPATINGNYGADPDYVRSEFRKISYTHYHQTANPEQWSGQVAAYSYQVTDKDFEQPRALWEIIKGEKGGQQFFLDNIGPSLKNTEPKLRERAIAMFTRVSEDLGKLLTDATK